MTTSAPPRRRVSCPRRTAGARGFTLAEVLAVVGIIAVMAAIATPGFAEMIRERRTQRETAMISEAFRSARAKALGRGAAVMVEVGMDPPSATISEKVDGAGMPVPSCGRTGDGITWRFVENVQGRPGSTELTALLPEPDGTYAPTDTLSICYSPRGRTYFNALGGENFSDQLNSVIDIQSRRISDRSLSQTRSILVMPNGQTRVSL